MSRAGLTTRSSSRRASTASRCSTARCCTCGATACGCPTAARRCANTSCIPARCSRARARRRPPRRRAPVPLPAAARVPRVSGRQDRSRRGARGTAQREMIEETGYEAAAPDAARRAASGHLVLDRGDPVLRRRRAAPRGRPARPRRVPRDRHADARRDARGARPRRDHRRQDGGSAAALRARALATRRAVERDRAAASSCADACRGSATGSPWSESRVNAGVARLGAQPSRWHRRGVRAGRRRGRARDDRLVRKRAAGRSGHARSR